MTRLLMILGVSLLLAGGEAIGAQSSAETFSWHGELVELNENPPDMTVKTRVLGEAAEDFKNLRTGERVMLTWSGGSTRADAIRRVAALAGAGESAARFSFPADFVAFDAASRHATFKVPIPARGVTRLERLEAGEWITATSPHGPASMTTPVVAVRPYRSPEEPSDPD